MNWSLLIKVIFLRFYLTYVDKILAIEQVDVAESEFDTFKLIWVVLLPSKCARELKKLKNRFLTSSSIPKSNLWWIGEIHKDWVTLVSQSEASSVFIKAGRENFAHFPSKFAKVRRALPLPVADEEISNSCFQSLALFNDCEINFFFKIVEQSWPLFAFSAVKCFQFYHAPFGRRFQSVACVGCTGEKYWVANPRLAA